MIPWPGFELRVALRFLREGRMQTVLIIVGVAAGVAIAEAGRGYDDQGGYAELPATTDAGSESCAFVRRLTDIDGRGVRMAATICVNQDGNAYVVEGSEYVLEK